MRIDTLEFRKCSYLGEEPEHCGGEICKWEPNPYYGKESEFMKDGEYYHPNTGNYRYVSIHQSCFKHPERCCSIATWNWDNHEDCYKLQFVGDRPINLLTEEEWSIFRELVRYGFRELNNWRCNE